MIIIIYFLNNTLMFK